MLHIWKNARLSQPVEFGPDGHGWKLCTDHSLEFDWFEGEQTPKDIKMEETGADANDNQSDDDEIYASSSDEWMGMNFN